VGFDQRYRGQLLALDGEAGARSLLEHEAIQLWTFATDDPGVVINIDRPTDLEAPIHERSGCYRGTLSNDSIPVISH
jgi:CTP:molybdopterin cytidylyltransferase MocA